MSVIVILTQQHLGCVQRLSDQRLSTTLRVAAKLTAYCFPVSHRGSVNGLSSDPAIDSCMTLLLRTRLCATTAKGRKHLEGREQMQGGKPLQGSQPDQRNATVTLC